MPLAYGESGRSSLIVPSFRGGQVGEDRPRDRVGLLDVGQVGGLRHHLEVRAGDTVADAPGVLGRGGRIFARPRRRAWGLDRGEPARQVEVPDRLATARVALRRCLEQHLPGPIDGGRTAGAELRGEPAFEYRIGNGLEALCPHRRGTLSHDLAGRSWTRCTRSTRRSTRSGASLASHMPTAPPIERPQKEKLSIPSASRSASRSRPRSSIRTVPAARTSRRGRGDRSAGDGRVRGARAPGCPTCPASCRGSWPSRARARCRGLRARGVTSRRPSAGTSWR